MNFHLESVILKTFAHLLLPVGFVMECTLFKISYIGLDPLFVHIIFNFLWDMGSKSVTISFKVVLFEV